MEDQNELPSILQEHDLGVEDALAQGIRLITPENTLEPEILIT